MKLPRVAVIATSAVVLVAGVFLGLSPITTSMTQISPELRLLTVTCGNGYLGMSPPVLSGDLVEPPGEPGVYLPRSTYETYCADAVGWRRLGAWVLTALGALGLAVSYAASRTPKMPDLPGTTDSGGSGGSTTKSRGGAHRARTVTRSVGKSVGKVAGRKGATSSVRADDAADHPAGDAADAPAEGTGGRTADEVTDDAESPVRVSDRPADDLGSSSSGAERPKTRAKRRRSRSKS